jgi:hypothetical protein
MKERLRFIPTWTLDYARTSCLGQAQALPKAAQHSFHKPMMMLNNLALHQFDRRILKIFPADALASASLAAGQIKTLIVFDNLARQQFGRRILKIFSGRPGSSAWPGKQAAAFHHRRSALAFYVHDMFVYFFHRQIQPRQEPPRASGLQN